MKNKTKINTLKPADYNPRKITKEQLESLKNAMEEFGDLSGIIFNRRTGNMVGGHQRIKAIPEDAEISKDKLPKLSRTGTVAEGYILLNGEKFAYREVDWDLNREKLANIAANKQGGEFDDDMLSALISELNNADCDVGLTGFSQHEIDTILDGLEETLEEKEEELKPYTMTHILISFPPEKMIEIQAYIEKIIKIEGVEYEQSSNG